MQIEIDNLHYLFFINQVSDLNCQVFVNISLKTQSLSTEIKAFTHRVLIFLLYFKTQTNIQMDFKVFAPH